MSEKVVVGFALAYVIGFVLAMIVAANLVEYRGGNGLHLLSKVVAAILLWPFVVVHFITLGIFRLVRDHTLP